MALNGIEEFVGEYLKIKEECDFIKYNEKFIVDTKDGHKQKGMSEVDVIGINLEKRIIFVCEVSAQMGGIYGEYKKKLDCEKNEYNKFAKNQRYIEEHFKGFEHKHMFWCPILTEGQKKNFTLPNNVELIDGQKFLDKINELKETLAKSKKDYASPVIRFLQILTYLEKNSKNK